MNRLLSCFLAGAVGGALMAFLIVGLLRVLVLDPSSQGGDTARMQARMDELEARIQRIELNTGQPDPKDLQRMKVSPNGQP